MKKTLSLNRNTLFRRLYYRGKAYSSPFFTLYVLNTKSKINRVGFTVSKKIGKAVVRNRARRLMYEAFRLYELKIKDGYYMVMVAKPAILKTDFETLKISVGTILEKADLIEK